MPSLLNTSRKWNQKDKGEVDKSLLQTLFLAVFAELVQRATKLQLEKSEDEFIQKLQGQAGWIN